MAETTTPESQVNFHEEVGKTFIWHEVYGPNTDQMIQFYTNALGMGTTSMNMGEMGDYHMLTNGGPGICGVWGTAGKPEMESVPPHWAVYIQVDDVDARLEKIKSLGGSCHVEPMDVPTVGRMAMCADPNGATFWIFKPEPM